MMAYPRSLPTSLESHAQRESNRSERPFQRTSLPPHSMFLRGEQSNNNNQNPHFSLPHTSKHTVSSRPSSPAESNNLFNGQSSYSYMEFEYGGSGETQNHRFQRNLREMYSSREWSDRVLPHLNRRSSSERMLLLDPNRNPIYDEALHFVTPSLSLIKEKKTEICADFVYEHFKCPICLDVLIEATAINCGHRFCLSCIDTWLKTKHLCPLCETRVTSKLRQFEIDNAINSVSSYLPEEWRRRRQTLLTDDRWKWTSSTALTPVSPDWVSQTLNSLFKGGQQIHRSGSQLLHHSSKTIASGVIWLNENVTLEGLVKGMLIGSFLALLWFTGSHFLSFLQYIYHAAKSYDTNVPAELQIEAVRKKMMNIEGHQLAKGQKRFQEFLGIGDTIYASFIEMFYKGWNNLTLK